MKPYLRALQAIVAAVAALPAVAHHSFAMFDASKTVTVEGTVRRFQWSNPHSWIYVTVADARGQPQDWPVELGAPNGLARMGWTPKTLTPGMNVKVQVHPLKDGQPGGQFLSMTLPDGTQLGNSLE